MRSPRRESRRRACLGLGTHYMRKLYQEALGRRGIRAILPPADQFECVNRITYDELDRDLVVPESKRFVVDVCTEMARRGAEGKALGCTGLPSLLTADDVNVDVYDSTGI